jgi:hypothetical protein
VTQSVDWNARTVRREVTGCASRIGSGERLQHQSLEVDDEVLAA